jgi:hypothetical protein
MGIFTSNYINSDLLPMTLHVTQIDARYKLMIQESTHKSNQNRTEVLVVRKSHLHFSLLPGHQTEVAWFSSRTRRINND